MSLYVLFFFKHSNLSIFYTLKKMGLRSELEAREMFKGFRVW